MTTYTKESLRLLVAESHSYAQVLRGLNSRSSGSTHDRIRRVIRDYGFDTSHFLGKRSNCGSAHKGGHQKLHWLRVLVYDRRGGGKERVVRLRNAMIAAGIPYVCATCGQLPTWQAKPLVLHISHKDGNFVNNCRENVWFQCPNCHSQTDDFAGRSAGKKNLKLKRGSGGQTWQSRPAQTGELCGFESHPEHQR